MPAAPATGGSGAPADADAVRVVPFPFHRRLLGRTFGELLLLPSDGGRGRELLVFLHG